MVLTNLRMILAERNLTISKVSEDTGISRTTLTSLSSNKAVGIQFDTLSNLLKYLKVAPSDFFLYSQFDVGFNFHFVKSSNNGFSDELEYNVEFYSFYETHHSQNFFTKLHASCLNKSIFNIVISLKVERPNSDYEDISSFAVEIEKLPFEFKRILENKIIEKLESVSSCVASPDIQFIWDK